MSDDKNKQDDKKKGKFDSPVKKIGSFGAKKPAAKKSTAKRK